MPIFSKLPKWIWGGAALLAMVAGCVNVVCILVTDQTVSHMTGNSSEIAIHAAHGDIMGLLKVIGVIGAFFLGAVVSGWIIRDSTLELGRRYGLALAIETAMLVVATVLLRRGQMVGIDAAAAACGLQNAMVSTYSGAIIRTTHLSGIFTDLGVLIGQRLRGMRIDHRRLTLFLVIICGFVGGGIIGAMGYRLFGVTTLLVPATTTALVAGAYTVAGLSGRFGKR